MSKVLWIIGNGFDKNLGLKTGYRSFLLNKYFAPGETIEYRDELVRRLDTFDPKSQSDLWSDLERLLGEVSQYYEDDVGLFHETFEDIQRQLLEYVAQEAGRLPNEFPPAAIDELRQINTFFIDFDIHTAKETISASDILTTAIDLGFMPTLIIKSDKGYQAYFVLETPVYVTSKSEFKSVKAAKIISQNIREYFGKSLPVDLTCNHFGIARIPRTDNVEFFDPNYRYSFKEWQDWSFKQTDNKGFTRSSLTVLSGTEGKKQVDEPWFNLLLHETKFSGEKGLIGRNNVMFTLSLAYFSSGYSIETCEYNMFEFNNRLDQPLEEKEVIKLVRSAYSENYQGANREYITILCKAWVSSDLTSKDLFVRQGWFKFKKKRSERQRVHLSEWKEDLMAYISEKSDVYKPYLVTTKKEIREALGIPERTLDKLLKVLKANQEIFFKIKPGRNGGIQLASVKSLLLSIIKVKKEEKESYIKALSEFFDLEHTFIQETLNKLAERPKTDTQLDLFSYDTG